MVSATSTKEFFIKKEKFVCTPSSEYVRSKIDGEQRTVYSSTFALFLRTIFCSVKKGFHSVLSSLRIVYSWLKEQQHAYIDKNCFSFFFGGVGQTAFAKSTITRRLIIVLDLFWSRSTCIELLFPTMYHTCLIDRATQHYALEPSFLGAPTINYHKN